MCRMKSTARRQHMVVTSSSSSDDDLSLGADQKKAPTLTRDVVFSSAVSQRRDGMPSQRGQITLKYETQWKDDLSM